MSGCTECIYRNPSTFKLCGKKCKENVFCHYHKKNMRDIYEIFHVIFGERNDDIKVHDIYRLFVYVSENVQFKQSEIDHMEMVKIFFIELLKLIPKNMLHETYAVYCIRKANFYNRVYELNSRTYELAKKVDISKLQSIVRGMIGRGLIERLDKGVPINTEDPFTYDSIDEILPQRLFTYCDTRTGIYAFDAVELDYFVQKCKKDGVEPYNPYTREIIDQGVLWKLEMFIKYNKLEKKKDECRWQTELHAFTDLSFEIEKQGFYNSPDWFMRMHQNHLIKSLKLFKDFSANVCESNQYFTENKKRGREAFVYAFCKEGIRLFKECKEDLYILCCNFMKALAMCSKDFYENLPEWLVNTNTTSRLSSMYSMFNETLDGGFSRGGPTARANRFMQNNTDNFLLYYYVEYME